LAVSFLTAHLMNTRRIQANSSAINFKSVRYAILAGVAGLVMLANGSQSYAQVGPDAGAIQQQLQREAEQRRGAPLPESLIKKQATPSESKSDEQALEVTSFRVTGITLITQEQAQEILTVFNNRKLTFDQIKEAGLAVTRLYNLMGRVAQATIPPQDVVNGQIWIKVIEGKVGNVLIDLDKQSPSRLKSKVIQQFISANNATGNFISLFGLERSLALLNETPGNEVSGELSPGDQEETSNIQLNAKDTGLVAGRVDVSNYGANNTGIHQISGNLSLNNPSGSGDQATLDVIGSEGSVFGQIKYGMPLGADGWRVSAGLSALNYKGVSSFSSTVTEGTAQTFGLYSTYALERTAKSNKILVVNFENKNYNNLTSGLQTSNSQINTFSAGFNGNHSLNQTYVNWGATATLGNLSLRNATQSNNDAQGAATQGNFSKLAFNASVSQALPFDRTNVITSIYGQFSSKNLNSAEQFYLGGPYGVRAYPVSQGGGAHGVMASVEVTRTYPNKLQLGAFFDAGFVQQYQNTYPNWQGLTHAANTYALFAAGPSVKYIYEKIQLQGALAFRIGNNSLYNQKGEQLNVSNQYEPVQAWAKATMFF
jgi:hemolysin activation/secretion protein